MNIPELKGAEIKEAYEWWNKQEAAGIDVTALDMAMRIDRLSAKVVRHSVNPASDVHVSGSDADQLLHRIAAFIDYGYTLARVEQAVLYVRRENGDDRPIRTLAEVMRIAQRLRDQRNTASAEARKRG